MQNVSGKLKIKAQIWRAVINKKVQQQRKNEDQKLQFQQITGTRTCFFFRNQKRLNWIARFGQRLWSFAAVVTPASNGVVGSQFISVRWLGKKKNKKEKTDNNDSFLASSERIITAVSVSLGGGRFTSWISQNLKPNLDSPTPIILQVKMRLNGRNGIMLTHEATGEREQWSCSKRFLRGVRLTQTQPGRMKEARAQIHLPTSTLLSANDTLLLQLRPWHCAY